jgi:hypothetical protein
MRVTCVAVLIVILLGARAKAVNQDGFSGHAGETILLANRFTWTTAKPVVHALPSGGEDWISVKDPSVVRFNGRWHLFCTVRGQKRSHAIVYLSFTDWSQAAEARHHVLRCQRGYFAAPQVFYFTPQKKWYMICQAARDTWEPHYQAAYSTSVNIEKPDSWTDLKPLFGKKPANVKFWLDFWVICDQTKAYLFFTSLDGKMWRAQTSLADFPRGWSDPVVALRGDVFEASHTYLLRGLGQYLTLIEAKPQQGRGWRYYLGGVLSLIGVQYGHGWRYYEAYVADCLDGDWNPLAAGKNSAFASMRNVDQTAKHWTDVISHGELLRAGYDERLEVDPRGIRFVFQGVLTSERLGKRYGEIPWRLGILEATGGALTKGQNTAN